MVSSRRKLVSYEKRMLICKGRLRNKRTQLLAMKGCASDPSSLSILLLNTPAMTVIVLW